MELIKMSEFAQNYNYANQSYGQSVEQQNTQTTQQQGKRGPSQSLQEALKFTETGVLSAKALQAYCMSITRRLISGNLRDDDASEVLLRDPVLSADLSKTQAASVVKDLAETRANIASLVEDARKRCAQVKDPITVGKIVNAAVFRSINTIKTEQQLKRDETFRQKVENIKNTESVIMSFKKDCLQAYLPKVKALKGALYNSKYRFWSVPTSSLKNADPSLLQGVKVFSSFADIVRPAGKHQQPIPEAQATLLFGPQGKSLAEVKSMSQSPMQSQSAQQHPNAQAQGGFHR